MLPAVAALESYRQASLIEVEAELCSEVEKPCFRANTELSILQSSAPTIMKLIKVFRVTVGSGLELKTELFTLISKTFCFLFCLFTCSLPETHAILQPLIDIERGEFSIPVVVSDSGSPSLSSNALVNVTVCPCDSFGDCKSFTAAIFGAKMGISFIALMIIIGSVAFLFCK